MKTQLSFFNEHDVLHDLKHYLPAQAPLKDFVHHNTLHAFQHLEFNKAIYHASSIFGYKVSLSLAEYRSYYNSGRINEDILERVIVARKGREHVDAWRKKNAHSSVQEKSTQNWRVAIKLEKKIPN